MIAKSANLSKFKTVVTEALPTMLVISDLYIWVTCTQSTRYHYVRYMFTALCVEFHRNVKMYMRVTENY